MYKLQPYPFPLFPIESLNNEFKPYGPRKHKGTHYLILLISMCRAWFGGHSLCKVVSGEHCLHYLSKSNTVPSFMFLWDECYSDFRVVTVIFEWILDERLNKSEWLG